MRRIQPLTVGILFEASEAAMEVGRKIKKRADKMRTQNDDVRSGKPITDKGHAQHVFKSDVKNPPRARKTGPVKGRLTKDQLAALKNRAKRKLNEPSKKSQRNADRAKAFDDYNKGESGNR